MDALREWTLCIIIAAAAGALACVLSPSGTSTGTIRTVAGIFVVAAVCAPLSGISVDEISIPAFGEFNTETAMNSDTREYVVSACRNAAEDEIISTAEECRIIVERIIADVYSDENNCIIIRNIQINIQAANEDAEREFILLVEKRLGVPVTVISE